MAIRGRLRGRTGTLVAIDAAVAVVVIAVSSAILFADSIHWPTGTRTADGLAAALIVVVNARSRSAARPGLRPG
jgi:hypothetical protein